MDLCELVVLPVTDTYWVLLEQICGLDTVAPYFYKICQKSGFEFADWTQKHHTSHNTWVDFVRDGLDTVASLNWTAVRALEAFIAAKRVEFRGGSNGNTPRPP